MADWKLTNRCMNNSVAVYDLHCDGSPFLQGVPYAAAMAHVLANGADTDTYSEDYTSKPQTVAELRAEDAAQ
jgi:hypothetical protein